MKTNLFFCIIILFLPVALFAQTPQEKGKAIYEEMDKRNKGFVDCVSEQKMILRNKHGQESLRIMRTATLEGDNDGDKMIIVFKKPKDINGTALLTHGHIGKNDDQWLYLPVLGRVKRISGASQAGSFVGSEFSFEDLGSQEVGNYTYKYLGEQEFEKMKTFVVERIPIDKKSGYTRQKTWIDKDEYRLQKVDFYDRKNVLLKTLIIKGYNLYLEKYWWANRFYMVNKQTGKSTNIVVSGYKFKNNLSDKDFTKNSLKRAR